MFDVRGQQQDRISFASVERIVMLRLIDSSRTRSDVSSLLARWIFAENRHATLAT